MQLSLCLRKKRKPSQRQVRRQSSVTGGGGGGGQKNVLGALTNFALKIGSKDQKKRSLSQIVPSFGAQFSLMGHVHSMVGRDGILWCGARLFPQIQG